MASQICTVPEIAPQVRKSESATYFWLAQPDCPLPVIRIGRRIFVRQDDIDALLNGTLSGAA